MNESYKRDTYIMIARTKSKVLGRDVILTIYHVNRDVEQITYRNGKFYSAHMARKDMSYMLYGHLMPMDVYRID